jgi:hypothetical protein
MFASDRASWQNPKVLTTLLLVFLCGAVFGALSMRAGLHQKLHNGTGFWRDDANQLSYDRMKKELGLTPRQAEQIKSVLDDFVKYHEDLEAQIEDVRATGKNRIMAILDDGQRQRFEQLCAEVQTR